MDQATPKIRAFAKRLTAYDALRSQSLQEETPGAFPVCDQLGRHLSTLIGNVGFRALLLRALALSKAEASFLQSVRVTSTGTLEWSEPLSAPVETTELLAGRVVLLAQLLGLLVAFIGPGLTSGLIREIWPQFSPNDSDFGKL